MKMDALTFEFGAQGGVVFDNTVVDDVNLPRIIGVRMRVGFRRRAVGRPTRVSNASVTDNGRAAQ